MEENQNNGTKVIKTDVGAKDGQNKCPKCGSTEISLNVKTGNLKITILIRKVFYL